MVTPRLKKVRYRKSLLSQLSVLAWSCFSILSGGLVYIAWRFLTLSETHGIPIGILGIALLGTVALSACSLLLLKLRFHLSVASPLQKLVEECIETHVDNHEVLKTSPKNEIDILQKLIKHQIDANLLLKEKIHLAVKHHQSEIEYYRSCLLQEHQRSHGLQSDRQPSQKKTDLENLLIENSEEISRLSNELERERKKRQIIEEQLGEERNKIANWVPPKIVIFRKQDNKELIALKKQFEEIRLDFETSKNLLQKQQITIEEEKNELKIAENNLQLANKQIQMLQNENVTLNESLTRQINTLTDQLAESTEQHGVITKQLKATTLDREQIETKHHRLVEKNELLTADRERIAEQLDKLKKTEKGQRSHIQNLKDSISKLEIQNQSLLEDNSNSQKETLEIQERFKRKKHELEQSLAELQEKYTALNKQQKQLSEGLGEACNRLGTEAAKTASIEEIVNYLSQQLSEKELLSTENEQLKSKFESIEQENQAHIAKIGGQEDQIRELEKENTNLEKQFKNSQFECKEHIEKIELIRTQSEKETLALKRSLERVNSELEQEKEEHLELISKHDSLDKEKTALVVLLSKNEKILYEQSQHIEQVEKNFREISQTKEKTAEEVHSLKQQISLIKCSQEEMAKQNASLQNERTQWEMDSKTQEEKHLELIEKLSEKNTNLEHQESKFEEVITELNALKSEAIEKDKTIKELDSEIGILKGTIESHEFEIDKYKGESQRASELKEVIDYSENQIALLKNALRFLRDKTQTLEKANSDLVVRAKNSEEREASTSEEIDVGLREIIETVKLIEKGNIKNQFRVKEKSKLKNLGESLNHLFAEYSINFCQIGTSAKHLDETTHGLMEVESTLSDSMDKTCSKVNSLLKTTSATKEKIRKISQTAQIVDRGVKVTHKKTNGAVNTAYQTAKSMKTAIEALNSLEKSSQKMDQLLSELSQKHTTDSLALEATHRNIFIQKDSQAAKIAMTKITESIREMNKLFLDLISTVDLQKQNSDRMMDSIKKAFNNISLIEHETEDITQTSELARSATENSKSLSSDAKRTSQEILEAISQFDNQDKNT